jgi:hypothetical protein
LVRKICADAIKNILNRDIQIGDFAMITATIGLTATLVHKNNKGCEKSQPFFLIPVFKYFCY